MRTSDDSLHFFINGEDQGKAVTNLPANVYGAVDIYGATVRVSIVSGTTDEEQELAQSNSMYQWALGM